MAFIAYIAHTPYITIAVARFVCVYIYSWDRERNAPSELCRMLCRRRRCSAEAHISVCNIMPLYIHMAMEYNNPDDTVSTRLVYCE